MNFLFLKLFLSITVTMCFINRVKSNDLVEKKFKTKENKYSTCIYEIDNKNSLIVDLSLIKWPLEWLVF